VKCLLDQGAVCVLDLLYTFTARLKYTSSIVSEMLTANALNDTNKLKRLTDAMNKFQYQLMQHDKLVDVSSILHPKEAGLVQRIIELVGLFAMCSSDVMIKDTTLEKDVMQKMQSYQTQTHNKPNDNRGYRRVIGSSLSTAWGVHMNCSESALEDRQLEARFDCVLRLELGKTRRYIRETLYTSGVFEAVGPWFATTDLTVKVCPE
jgi:hypothetical protein